MPPQQLPSAAVDDEGEYRPAIATTPHTRQSEQIALTIHDCDLAAGKISINKAVVATMLKTYAAWTKGATAADVEIIKRALWSARPYRRL